MLFWGKLRACQPNIESLLDNAQAGVNPAEVDYGTTCAILWTSGTTGRAKGVMQSHNNWIRAALSAAELGDVGKGDVLYNCLPLYNSAAWVANIYPALISGTTVAMDAGFSAGAFLGPNPALRRHARFHAGRHAHVPLECTRAAYGCRQPRALGQHGPHAGRSSPSLPRTLRHRRHPPGIRPKRGHVAPAPQRTMAKQRIRRGPWGSRRRMSKWHCSMTATNPCPWARLAKSACSRWRPMCCSTATTMEQVEAAQRLARRSFGGGGRAVRRAS